MSVSLGRELAVIFECATERGRRGGFGVPDRGQRHWVSYAELLAFLAGTSPIERVLDGDAFIAWKQANEWRPYAREITP